MREDLAGKASRFDLQRGLIARKKGKYPVCFEYQYGRLVDSYLANIWLHKMDMLNKATGIAQARPSFLMAPKRTNSNIQEEDASKTDTSQPRKKVHIDPGNINSGSVKTLPYPKTEGVTAPQTQFQQPSQLITFSYSPTHEQEFSNAAMRYFVDPPIEAKLDYGYDRWIRKPDERGRLDGLLKAISRIRSDPARAPLVDVGVVAWRGIITK